MIDRASDHYALDITRARTLLGWGPREAREYESGHERHTEQPDERLHDWLPTAVEVGRHSPDAEPLEGRAALGYTLVGRAWARRSGRTTAGDGRVHRRPPGTLRGRADMRCAADRPVEGEGQ